MNDKENTVQLNEDKQDLGKQNALSSKRIGIAAGKFKIPDDSFFFDDEIAESIDDI